MSEQATHLESQALINESLERAALTEAALVEQLFTELFLRHPTVHPLFSTHTDANRHRMVHEILELARTDWDEAPWLMTILSELGIRHEAYDVTEEMFAWMTQCLLDVLAENAGDSWKPDYETAWRAVFARLASNMLG
ncbi:MAG: globin domain-containing protein [Pseudomonadales bacterium]